jgi:hypothetical protein
MDTLDTGIRLKAFQFLDEQSKLHGEVLPRTILAKGRSGDPALTPGFDLGNWLFDFEP